MERGGTSRNDGKAAGPDNSNSKNSLPRVFQRSFRPPPHCFLPHLLAPPSFLRYNNRFCGKKLHWETLGPSSRARSRRRHSSFFQASSTTSDEALSQSGVNVVDHARTAQSLSSSSKTPLRDSSPSSQGRQVSQSPPDRLSPPKVSSRG